MFYTIGETAKMLGVAPSALRYYDKEGLLPFVERSESGLRMFTESDMDWLKVIQCLKATGMPIKGIRRFIECAREGDGTISERLNILKAQRENVITQIKEIEEHLKMLDYKVWYYSEALKAGSTEALKNYPEQSIPEKFRPFFKK